LKLSSVSRYILYWQTWCY